ncbi:MAG: MogA/MoaB family molybdenum cofactor biosynthesis protein [Elusimicrobia bacterium]|nr:MogA/MoaB family molybdenum cofactor biosynthesis protein [Elusimicrobiota bacterium]
MTTVGILTVSDRAFEGIYEDTSGPELKRYVEKKDWRVECRAVVPDEKEEIKKILVDWSDHKGIGLILTAGGTGLGPRDVTPEATREVLEKELPGISEAMRREGAKKTPLAALSRAMAGSRNKSLILNLPGSPRGAVESLEAVCGILPHALSMLMGEGHRPHEAVRLSHVTPK